MDNIFIAVVSYGTTYQYNSPAKSLFRREPLAACLVFASKAPRHKDETEEINGPRGKCNWTSPLNNKKKLSFISRLIIMHVSSFDADEN